jgi:hypothetical protein
MWLFCCKLRRSCQAGVGQRGLRRPPIFLRADFAFTRRLGSPREQAFANGCNSGADRRNLHEKPPVPMGGSSYLSAIGMPVVEPTVTYIWALLPYYLAKIFDTVSLFSRQARHLPRDALTRTRAHGTVGFAYAASLSSWSSKLSISARRTGEPLKSLADRAW